MPIATAASASSTLAESGVSAGVPEPAAPPALASFENERVREFEPPAALVSEAAPPGPGFAVAAPVKIEWPTDLQQVESDPDKVRAAEDDGGQEPAAPRQRRLRQPLPPLNEEPLVQIETGQSDAPTAGKEEKAPA